MAFLKPSLRKLPGKTKVVKYAPNGIGMEINFYSMTTREGKSISYKIKLQGSGKGRKNCYSSNRGGVHDNVLKLSRITKIPEET